MEEIPKGLELGLDPLNNVVRRCPLNAQNVREVTYEVLPVADITFIEFFAPCADALDD
jgi:hypothetical protein